jgi:hypothetical protein
LKPRKTRGGGGCDQRNQQRHVNAQEADENDNGGDEWKFDLTGAGQRGGGLKHDRKLKSEPHPAGDGRGRGQETLRHFQNGLIGK